MSSISYPAISPDYLYDIHANGEKLADVRQTKITIEPVLNVGIETTHVTIEISGEPGISLSQASLKDKRNLGPFIESVTYKITPLTNGIFRKASPSGTEEKHYTITYSKEKSFSITGEGSVGYLHLLHHHLQGGAEGGAHGSVEFGSSVKRKTETEEKDFMEQTFRTGNEIYWTKSIRLFVKNDQPEYYHGKLEELRTCHHGTRAASLGTNWKKDELNDVPQAAKSSIKWCTMATFERQVEEELKFKITVCADVIMLSNECINPSRIHKAPYSKGDKASDKTGDYLYWVRTKHTVEKTVTIAANAIKPEASPFTHSEKTAEGYSRRKVPNNGTKKEMTLQPKVVLSAADQK